jgi:hypothetical protein
LPLRRSAGCPRGAVRRTCRAVGCPRRCPCPFAGWVSPLGRLPPDGGGCGVGPSAGAPWAEGSVDRVWHGLTTVRRRSFRRRSVHPTFPPMAGLMPSEGAAGGGR